MVKRAQTSVPRRHWLKIGLIGLVVVIAAPFSILALTSTISYWVGWVGDDQVGTSIISYCDGTTLV